MNSALPSTSDVAFTDWNVLASCGTTGASAFARELRSGFVLREADSTRVREFFILLYAWRTTDLFEALRTAALSRSATPFVRRRAVQALGALHSPLYDFAASAVAQPSAAYCGYNPNTVVRSRGSVADLPSDYLTSIVETMSSIESENSVSSDLRGLAHCWRVTLERKLAPDAKAIKLKHVCGMTFTVENGNPMPVRVTASVEGRADQYSIVARARASDTLSVLYPGKVVLTFNGVRIDQKETTSKKCKQAES